MQKGKRMMTPSFGSRDSVIRAILQREQENLPLNCLAVMNSMKPLHSGALRHFGSWRNALQAAGINIAATEQRRRWNKTEIVIRLRQLCRNGRSLRQSSVCRHDSGLCRASRLAFGSWCKALIAAGINPESICRDLQWDQSKIVEAILLRAVRGDSLGSTTVRPRALKTAAVREFGSWPAALTAAGLAPLRILKPRRHVGRERRRGDWNKERVRKMILQRHALGLSLSGNAVLRDIPTLYFAARTWFGSWAKALVDAGVGPVQHD